MKLLKNCLWLLPFLILVSLSACSDNDGNPGGDMVLRITDAATPEYQGVYVTIEKILVCTSESESTECKWEVVAEPQKTYNLLDLVNGKTDLLGSVTLEPGQYSQLRLIISDTPDDSLNLFGEGHPFANYVVTNDGDIHELKIPSGMESGIKLVHEFTIADGGMVDLILDFNALKSIVKAGSSGIWLLKPTIKIIDTMTYAEISGTVHDEQTGEPLEGALIIAQLSDTYGKANIVQTASVTDVNGEYKLLIEPGLYSMAVSMEGYTPITMDVDLLQNDAIVADFVLSPAETGVIKGTVTLVDGEEFQSITISIRIPAEDDDSDPVEFDSIQILPGGEYEIELPAGEFLFVVSTEINGEEIVFMYDTVNVEINATITFNINIGEDIIDDDDDDEGDDEGDDDADDDADDSKKVKVCHNGHTIVISKSALPAHLDHGDTEGACDSDGDDSGDDSEDGDDDEDDDDDD